MFRWPTAVLACALSWHIGLNPVLADSPPPLTADEQLILRMAPLLLRSKSLETAIKNQKRIFDNTDIDGDGVSARDYRLAKGLNDAGRRASILNTWLRKDLDGNGEVSREELEIVLGREARRSARNNSAKVALTDDQVREIFTRRLEEALVVDVDKDGVVTFREMLKLANEKTFVDRPKLDSDLPVPLSLDADGDGRVSEEEFDAVLERVVSAVDTDGDGSLSEPEKKAAKETIRNLGKRASEIRHRERIAAKNREIAEACTFPAPPEGAEILYMSAYEGAALSTIALGGDDADVSVIDLRIEPGEPPLYVLLASYEAVIWRFSGAVDRVVQVAVNSWMRDPGGAARAGVAGLPAERIHFTPKKDCLRHFTDPYNDKKAAAALELVPFLLGRGADHVAATYSAGPVSLPSGELEEIASYPGRRKLPVGSRGEVMWQEIDRFFPGGLVETDPASVVSPVAVAPYRVLPKIAGIAQLLDERLLEVAEVSPVIIANGIHIHTGGGRDSISVPKGTSIKFMEKPSKFTILGKITLPAGLCGAFSTTFILPPGIPEPDGNPCHSKILREK